MRMQPHDVLSATGAAAIIGVATSADAQPYGWGMMGGDGFGFGGFGAVHMIVWVFILIAVVAGVVWLARSMAGGGTPQALPHRPQGLDTLEERYARGEINREEYLQKKSDLT